MDKKKFLNELVALLKQYGENNLQIINNNDSYSLLINVEEDDGVPSYKMIISIFDDYVSALSCFEYQTKVQLLNCLNKINEQSFLTFSCDEHYIKASYKMIEVDNNDVKKVLQIITLIPNEIDQYFKLIKKYIG